MSSLTETVDAAPVEKPPRIRSAASRVTIEKTLRVWVTLVEMPPRIRSAASRVTIKKNASRLGDAGE